MYSAIKEEQIQDIANYLQRQPYFQVVKLIEMLRELPLMRMPDKDTKTKEGLANDEVKNKTKNKD